MSAFHAVVIRARDAAPALESLPAEALPDGDVLVDVHYSGLNYKDALAICSPDKVVRRYPMVPGIDFAGVVSDARAGWTPGDRVVLTGWGAGETHWGGLSQRARVTAEWLVPLPARLTLLHAMSVGTAGFTAMLCVMALEEHGLAPGSRPVVVTGAAGAVGSLSVALLARLGYEVAALTGRPAEAAYLRQLGAREIIDRAVFLDGAAKPLQSERWGGAIDAVGGDVLGRLLPAMAAHSCVASCGVAAGPAFSATVLPFVLRGVSILGVNSVLLPPSRRLEAWRRLADLLTPDVLDAVTTVVTLRDVVALSPDVLAGRTRGRVVVDTSVA